MRVMSPSVHRPASTPCPSLAQGDSAVLWQRARRRWCRSRGGGGGTESEPCRLRFSIRVFTGRLTPFKRLIYVC